MVDAIEYYSRRSVCEEIAAFLQQRWAAVEGRNKFWVRWSGDRPLRISSPADVEQLAIRYRAHGVRSFYGTIEVFHRLEARRDVEEGYEGNVAAATVFIDIDIVSEDAVDRAWKYAVKAAKALIDTLEEHGVTESVYIVWSGAGVHVRVSEKAFHEAYRHAHPVDVAFAVAEYVLEKAMARLAGIVKESQGLVKIENLVAPKRVFTAPLSLHRRLDAAVVALQPSSLSDFTPEWSNPENPQHDPKAWRRHRVGEADELALKALEKIGRLKRRTLMDARATRIGAPISDTSQQAAATQQQAETSGGGRIGRFQVMGLLQAARYYLLTGDLERAKSWGLNRAIFYAWAKHYGPARRAHSARHYSSGRRVSSSETRWVEIGGEKAQISKDGWFVMGGVEQRPEDFDRHIARRFEEAGIPFDEAWRAALDYLRRFPKSVLRDPQRFFHEVYEPVRDRFEEKVLGKRSSRKGVSLDKWFRKTG